MIDDACEEWSQVWENIGVSRKQLDSQMAALFGGRVAEEIIFGEDNVTTGASNDIKQATTLANRMVCKILEIKLTGFFIA